MPSTRTLGASLGLAGLLGATGLVAAQSPDPGAGLDFGVQIGLRFVAALVINLLLGGALVAFGPRYAREAVGDLRDDPISAFGWGLVFGIGAPIALVLIGITIVGLIVTIPGLLVLAVLGILGNAVSVVWVGSLLTSDGGDVGGSAAVVGAAAFAALTAIPLLGSLLSSILGLCGLGVAGRGLYVDWRG
jgi:hypothetical protein